MTNVKRLSRSAKLVAQYLNHRVTPETQLCSVKGFYQALDTPVSLACWLLYEAGEFEQLVSKDCDPNFYNSAQSFKLDLAAISFLRKSNFLATGIDTQAVALKKFREAEKACCLTNRRLKDLGSDPSFKGPNVWLFNSFVRKIHTILGTLDIEEIFSKSSWGPGATSQITGNDTTAVRKFRYEKQITNKLYNMVGPFLDKEYPLWFTTTEDVFNLERVHVSKVLTVPKNAKTDRTIAIEPGINSWFQKGTGSLIRSRLRRAGYDLNSSAKNRDMARKGSCDSTVATIDFSAASDTIAYELIRAIVPYHWWRWLDACRTPSYYLAGDPSRTSENFHKFSSMGNGFTFELESLIFIAAAEAVTEYLDLDRSCLAVHGDDITMDSAGSDLYRTFSEFLGFQVNEEKTFAGPTPFRESCGDYWYDGVDVKPFFLKEKVDDAKGIFRLANGITRVAHRYGFGHSRDIRFYPLHTALVESLPPHLRVKGDSSMGDVCIASNFDEATPAVMGIYHSTLFKGFRLSGSSTDPFMVSIN